LASKKHKNRRQQQTVRSPGRGSRPNRWIAIAALVLVAAVAAFVWWGGNDRQDDIASLHSLESAQRLVGRWQRTDAGYEIDIRHVDRNGTVEAVYLNPNQIHVSQARASDAEGGLDLFIELRDVGYPGATYQLRYSPEHDVLAGLYYQPTAGQTFEVAFERK
jgi:hypothetical protein